MPKGKLYPFIAEISGTLGDVVIKKSKVKGEAIVAKRPKKPRKPSKAQQAPWDRITEAAAYAAAALADPELGAYYEAEAEKLDMQLPNVAIADYLNGKNLITK